MTVFIVFCGVEVGKWASHPFTIMLSLEKCISKPHHLKWIQLKTENSCNNLKSLNILVF